MEKANFSKDGLLISEFSELKTKRPMKEYLCERVS